MIAADSRLADGVVFGYIFTATAWTLMLVGTTAGGALAARGLLTEQRSTSKSGGDLGYLIGFGLAAAGGGFAWLIGSLGGSVLLTLFPLLFGTVGVGIFIGTIHSRRSRGT